MEFWEIKNIPNGNMVATGHPWASLHAHIFHGRFWSRNFVDWTRDGITKERKYMSEDKSSVKLVM